MSSITKSVSFATQAEVHVVDVVAPNDAAATWYSVEEVSTNAANISPPGACPECLYKGNSTAIDTILDAQHLMDEIGATDAGLQASILAAVSAKCSEKARSEALVAAALFYAHQQEEDNMHEYSQENKDWHEVLIRANEQQFERAQRQMPTCI